jgi:hypothetical protein
MVITPAPVPQQLETTISSRRYGRLAWFTLAVLAMVIASFVWLWPTRSAPSQGAIRFTIDPPVGHILEPAGSRQAFAVSPDGSRLAITALNPNGLFGVWIRDLAAQQPRYLPLSSERPEAAGAEFFPRSTNASIILPNAPVAA